MAKGVDPKLVKAIIANLTKSGKGVADDVVKSGGNLVDEIKAAMAAVTGSAPKAPRVPKNPPKSRAVASEKPLTPAEYASAKADDASLAKTGRELVKEEKLMGTGSMDANDLAILKLYKSGAFTTTSKLPKNPPKSGRGKNPPAAGAVVPAPKNPKPKSPKTGTADAAERAATKNAKSEANSAKWAEEREAYNAVKRAEREARKAKNKADWAKRLETEFDGNVVAARKATSKGANKNKKGKR